jgi:hypothetical protein
MMNKTIDRYEELTGMLYQSLTQLKKLMNSKEWSELQIALNNGKLTDEEYERVEMMYGSFEGLVEDLASSYV